MGIDGSVTPQATRLISLAGASWSYDVAAARLHEFCGLTVSDNTIRSVCYKTAGLIGTWRNQSDQAVQDWTDGEGDWEFQTDGAFINTVDGWREMKLGIFARRHRASTAFDRECPDPRSHPRLPAPHLRWAFAEIAECDVFSKRWRPLAGRLGLSDFTQLTVIADGAEWIWNAAEVQFGGSRGILDIYHALQRINEAARAIYGDGTEASREAMALAKERVYATGIAGVWEWIGLVLTEENTDARQLITAGLVTYFVKHLTHMNYAARREQGQNIGSGMVEGGCKQLIGRRLKQTGAKWQPQNANRMVELSCMVQTLQWEAYFSMAA